VTRPSRFDPIAFVETAYRLDLDESRWIAELVRAAMPGLDQGLGVGAAVWRMGTGGVEVVSVSGEMEADLLALVPRTYEGLPPSLVARYLSGPPHVLRLSDDPESIRFALARIAASGQGHRVRDIVGAQIGDGRGRGLSFGAFAARRARFGRSRYRAWLRLMSHVGAAQRLRTRIGGGALACAVVEPSGRVAHAEGELREDSPQQALVRAVRAIERARGRLRKQPDDALAAWRALVDGKWSVVDWLDVDGRRFLVAYENDLGFDDSRMLTPRERVVVEYVVHGRTSSEIAYALGLGVASVEALTRQALRKLRGARRTDLAALFGAGPPIAHRLDERIVALTAPARDRPHWDRLSEAESAVAAMAIDGASNDEIARVRRRSVRTIANQLARVYRVFGVRGRTELAALLGAPQAR
jgi:DNA-binding CsgD family transcriptional regulator